MTMRITLASMAFLVALVLFAAARVSPLAQALKKWVHSTRSGSCSAMTRGVPVVRGRLPAGLM